MLGDAAPGDAKEAILDVTIPDTDLLEGQRLGESFNDGPAYWDTNQVKLIKETTPTIEASECVAQQYPAVGEVMTEAVADSYAGLNQAGAAAAEGLILRDTRDWFAVHRAGCNILMADGSVNTFADLNRDGFLNPGFPIATTIDKTTLARATGYTDNVCELNNFELFAGVFLNFSIFTKQNFEAAVATP